MGSSRAASYSIAGMYCMRLAMLYTIILKSAHTYSYPLYFMSLNIIIRLLYTVLLFFYLLFFLQIISFIRVTQIASTFKILFFSTQAQHSIFSLIGCNISTVNDGHVR